MTLEEYLFENGFLVWEFADIIGCCPNYMSGIKNGTRKVSKKMRYRVMKATNGKVMLEVSPMTRKSSSNSSGKNIRATIDKMKEANVK